MYEDQASIPILAMEDDEDMESFALVSDVSTVSGKQERRTWQ